MEPAWNAKDKPMKKLILAAAAFGALGLAAGTASAATYRPAMTINQQERDIALRIDQGVRNHSLTAAEARDLRGQLNGVERLEARYRKGGFTAWERNDLQRRLNALSARVRAERHDRDFRGDGHFDRHGF
jgi:hypothetical protein